MCSSWDMLFRTVSLWSVMHMHATPQRMSVDVEQTPNHQELLAAAAETAAGVGGEETDPATCYSYIANGAKWNHR